jgi:hypothetical protein
VCISKNRQGIPLTRVAVVVALINATTTAAGLTVTCVIDESKYKTGIKITDEEIDKLNSIKADFHGEGNYSVAAYT